MSSQELIAMGLGSGSAHPQVDKAESADRASSGAVASSQAHSVQPAPPAPPRAPRRLPPIDAGGATEAPASAPSAELGPRLHPMMAKTASAEARSGQVGLPVNGAHSLMAGLPSKPKRRGAISGPPGRDPKDIKRAEAEATRQAALTADYEAGRAKTGSRSGEVGKPLFVAAIAAGTGLGVGNTSGALDDMDGSSGVADQLLGVSGSQMLGTLAAAEVTQGIMGIDAGMGWYNGNKMVKQGEATGDKAWAELGKDKIAGGKAGVGGALTSMAAGGLKAGGKVLEGSSSALGTFGSAGTALIGAGGVLTAGKAAYDLYSSGKSFNKATKTKADAKAKGAKLRTSLGQLWMKRVAARQAVKQKTSLLKGLGAALGLAGAIASMLTPVGWAIALAGAVIGIGIAGAKIVKKVQDAGPKKKTESIFSKMFSRKKRKDDGPAIEPALHPQQAKAASAGAALSPNAAHSLAEPSAAQSRGAQTAESGARAAAEQVEVAPIPEGASDAEAAELRAESYAGLGIEPGLGFDPEVAAAESPATIEARAKAAQGAARPAIEALESNQQAADGIHEALVADRLTGEPFDEERDRADEEQRSYGNDAGLVVGVLGIEPAMAASPSGSALLQKRMSALDGL